MGGLGAGVACEHAIAIPFAANVLVSGLPARPAVASTTVESSPFKVVSHPHIDIELLVQFICESERVVDTEHPEVLKCRVALVVIWTMCNVIIDGTIFTTSPNLRFDTTYQRNMKRDGKSQKATLPMQTVFMVESPSEYRSLV